MAWKRKDLLSMHDLDAAEIGDLLDTARHAGIENVRVQIDPHDVPVWGFISVTNNITQQVTLVTPQRPL